MRTRIDQGSHGLTIPANTQTATFIATGRYRPTDGVKTARADGELRLLIGSGEAQPAMQFANSWDGTPVHQSIGTNMTANGTSPPAAATDMSTNAGQYLLMRPGWLVKNTHATNTASIWLTGTIDVWGD